MMGHILSLSLPPSLAMIKQFLTDVVWGQLDYLIIDTPPGNHLCSLTHSFTFSFVLSLITGTSDEHISVVENIKSIEPDGAILVTTPQVMSV